MICPNCKTKYYSKTHCPKCGQGAFTLNKRRRVPTKANYRSIYVAAAAAFIVMIFIALTFLNMTDSGLMKDESSEGENLSGYKKYSLIRIVDEKEPASGAEKAAPEAERAADVTGMTDEIDKGSAGKEISDLNMSGVKAFKEGDYDKAYIYFFQAYSLDKKEPSIKRNLYNTLIAKGSKRLEKKEYVDALKQFKKAITFIDDDLQAYKGMGLSYSGLSDLDKALDSFIAAFNIDKNNDELNIAIGKIYFSRQDYENSKKFFDRVNNKSKYRSDIALYSKLNEKNIKEVSGKKIKDTTHFRVFFDGYEDPVAGNLVSMILEELYYSIGSDLNHYPGNKVTAVLYTNKQFDENIELPDWAGALYDGKIKLPAGGIKNRSNKLKEVLAHEYTHAVIFSKVQKNCPTWLNEGLAQILSLKQGAGDDALRYIVTTGKLPSLAALHKNFTEMGKEEAAVAYAVSMAFTAHLIKKYSMSSVNDLLDRLSYNEGVKIAFKDTFYTRLSDSYEDFIKELKKRHG